MKGKYQNKLANNFAVLTYYMMFLPESDQESKANAGDFRQSIVQQTTCFAL